MHTLKSIYCRTFQTALKIALPFLPYRTPKIVGSVKKLPEIIQQEGCSSVLLITDAQITKLGLTKRLEHSLCNSGISYTIYDKTVANPTTTNVAEALELYHLRGCDCIIGFGGGSSIDCAKAVGAKIAKPKQSLAKMKGILKVHKKLPLLMAVPTTAGTGSETTLAAVITDAQTRYKYAINDFPLIPKYAVLDPKVTVSLPPFITATTGMDALTHAVEAYIGRSTTYGTRKDALLAVKLIFENIDTAYTDGTNVDARRNMLTLLTMPDVPLQNLTLDMYTLLLIHWAGSITFLTDLQMQSFFHMSWKNTGKPFTKNLPNWQLPQELPKKEPPVRRQLMPSSMRLRL